VVMIGQKGLTPAVRKELDDALDHHELVKVRIAGEDRAQRSAVIERLREISNAEIVQKIGRTACFYRRNPDKAILALPK
ncbi:MAG TPA: YhbY family RNA-binding protein, partial [Rhodanobacteraceae bacterium]|nr:YhbY family RNA-binding protein [Rhodanobacteraceae bacterium]